MRHSAGRGMIGDRAGGGRAGFSLLELEVAFILFGMALAGLCPLVVMQSRQLRRLEGRVSPQSIYHLTPARDGWARKLGASASMGTVDPGPAPAAPVMVIDNRDVGYAEADGAWKSTADASAYHAEYRRHAAGSGSGTGTWTFTGLAPGWYDVEVTWVPAGDRAGNAPYTIFDGAAPLRTIAVDQTAGPVGPKAGGVSWSSLGQYQITGNTLSVQLGDNANGFVIADAARVVAVRNVVSVALLERSLGIDEETAHVTVTMQAPP